MHGRDGINNIPRAYQTSAMPLEQHGCFIREILTRLRSLLVSGYEDRHYG